MHGAPTTEETTFDARGTSGTDALWALTTSLCRESRDEPGAGGAAENREEPGGLGWFRLVWASGGARVRGEVPGAKTSPK